MPANLLLDASEPEPPARSAFDVAYVNPFTYPLSAPYRNRDGMPYGKPARVLSVVFCTLLNTVNDSWDPRRGELTVRGDFYRLCRRFRLGSGTQSHRTLTGQLLAFQFADFAGPDCEPFEPFEPYEVDGSHLEGTVLRPTRRFVDVSVAHARRVPPDPLSSLSSPMRIDLLMLAAMHCPDERGMLIPWDVLRTVLPAASATTLLRSTVHAACLEVTRAQTWWRFEDGGRGVRVRPVTAPAGHAVVLRPR